MTHQPHFANLHTTPHTTLHLTPSPCSPSHGSTPNLTPHPTESPSHHTTPHSSPTNHHTSPCTPSNHPKPPHSTPNLALHICTSPHFTPHCTPSNHPKPHHSTPHAALHGSLPLLMVLEVHSCSDNLWQAVNSLVHLPREEAVGLQTHRQTDKTRSGGS